ncbi:hypothetical protein BDN70DRAFT_873085 [Pholiota conissans]|uniref:Uncharacterized protein n=1 Tax=Pholiota conissans TaxID=109636 RepID=A0A9P5Z984_9AGAR|nr:hypothetical protein BDN70DRAFT_873085 [Pholiota conissans]
MDAHRLNVVHRRQLGLPLTDLFPPLGPSKTTDASTSATSTSSSSSSTITTSTSTTSSSTTTSSTTTSTSTTSTSASTFTTATPARTSTPVTLVSNSSTITIFETASVPPSTTPSPSSTATAVTSQGFLQNKPLSGVIFALVGLIGLVLVIIAATFMIRRRRSNRLLNEALSFNPVNVDHDGPDMMETGRRLTNDRTSTSTGHASHGNGPLITHAGAFADYTPPPMPCTPTSLHSQRLSRPLQKSYPAGGQPYAQNYDWTRAPIYQNPAYDKGTSYEDEESRRSGSSSGEFQFAAPVNASGGHR